MVRFQVGVCALPRLPHTPDLKTRPGSDLTIPVSPISEHRPTRVCTRPRKAVFHPARGSALKLGVVSEPRPPPVRLSPPLFFYLSLDRQHCSMGVEVGGGEGGPVIISRMRRPGFIFLQCGRGAGSEFFGHGRGDGESDRMVRHRCFVEGRGLAAGWGSNMVGRRREVPPLEPAGRPRREVRYGLLGWELFRRFNMYIGVAEPGIWDWDDAGGLVWKVVFLETAF